jgi:hypothetical protein
MAEDTTINGNGTTPTTTTGNGMAATVAAGEGGERQRVFNRRAAEEVFAVMNAAIVSRAELVRRFADPRRDVDDECGYPDTGKLTELYTDMYERQEIAARVVEVWAKEAWQVHPKVYEKEDAGEVTSFEAALKDVFKQLRGEYSWYRDETGGVLWNKLKKADIEAGIESYSVVLLGLDDADPDMGRDALRMEVPFVSSASALPQGVPAIPVSGTPPSAALSTVPAEAGRATAATGAPMAPTLPTLPNGSTPGAPTTPAAPATPSSRRKKQGPVRKLVYLKSYPQRLATIAEYETDAGSPRFGQPLYYDITLNDPQQHHGGIGLDTSTVRAHWSRVVHISDGEVYGTPRMQRVLNRLLDLKKLYGADAEAFWKGCLMKLILETNPNLGGDVEVDKEALKDMMEDFGNGMQPWMLLMGMTAKGIAPSVVDPSSHIDKHIEAICIYLGIPIRIFKGSERGELASSQDDMSWNDRVKEHQNGHTTQHVIIPVIDRLIAVGVLPVPQEGYTVWWPDITSMTAQEKAGLASTIVGAITQYVSGQCEKMITPLDFWTILVKFTDEEAQSIIDNVAAALEEQRKAAEADPPQLGEQERADVAAKVIGVLSAFVGGGVEAILPPKALYEDVLKWSPEKAQKMIDETAGILQEQEKVEEEARAVEEQKAAEEALLNPEPLPGQGSMKPGAKLKLEGVVE